MYNQNANDMMQDDSSGSDDSGMSGPMEMCVPISAVSTQDGSDSLVAPEVDDEVQMDVVGKVTRIEGENAYITPTKVNGEEISNDESDSNPQENESDKMRSMAMQADQMEQQPPQ